ncbi:hypothetical protein ACGFT2_13925 [Streptomyces sp. NPDC048514]|uniref:hypothetical protein n=1 Tax=Streptomyces sp. NPDC048514 TaxID=3365564 RepID=UPI0037234716
MELHITRWKRYGHDRLYASLSDGTAVGWADVRTGAITVLRADYRNDVIAQLTQHLQNLSETAPADRTPDTEARPVL